MKKWLSAMRLRTLPLAASCILAGSSAAWLDGQGNATILILALTTTFLLQILSNLANDFGDFESGVDNLNRVGPDRAMQSGKINRKEMIRALIICSVLALISGILLLWFALSKNGNFLSTVVFFAFGLLSIVAALKYTIGKSPYGYKGLGDVFVFLFFGILGVNGTFYLYTQQIEFSVFVLSAAIGLLSTAVLNLNNLRDHVNDKAGNKMTMVVKLGFDKGKMYHYSLVLSAVMLGWAWCWTQTSSMGIFAFIPVLALLPQIFLLKKVVKTQDPAELDSELKKVALLTFLFSLLLFINALR